MEILSVECQRVGGRQTTYRWRSMGTAGRVFDMPVLEDDLPFAYQLLKASFSYSIAPFLSFPMRFDDYSVKVKFNFQIIKKYYFNEM